MKSEPAVWPAAERVHVIQPMRVACVFQRVVDIASLATMVAGYSAFFWITRGLWQVPRGSHIRPMGMAVAMLIVGIATPVAVMIVSNLAPERDPAERRSFRLSDFALAGSCGVLLLTFIYMPLVAWLRGLHLGG